MKRSISLILVLTMVVLLCSSCGQTQQSQTSAPQSTATAAPTEAVPEEVTLHLFHQKQEAQETFAQIIEEFHEEYPYINVEQEIVTNDPASVLKSRVATDEIPDILQGSLDTMDIAQGGYIVDLTGDSYLDNINDAALAADSFTDSEGHTWAMPIDGSCEGIFYNKEIFSKYNLNVPTTIEELDNVIATLEANGVTPFALGFKDSWTIKPVTLVAACPAIYGKDISWDAQRTAGTASFQDTEGWTTVFELLKKVYEHGNTKTAFDTDYNGACGMIASGEAAMMIQGLWALEPIRAINADIDLGMMAMPVSDSSADAKLFQFPDFGLSISSHSKHIEESKLFLEFLTRPEIAELWCNTAKLFSAVKGISVDFDPLTADVNAYIDAGMVCTQGDRGWPTAFHADYEAQLSEYILGKVTVENVMQNLDASWDKAASLSN